MPMKKRMSATMQRKLAKIKIIAMDVDGVLTDGGMYYSDKGEIMKKFNARDGKAMEMLRNYGFQLVWITGEDSAIVKARAKKLRITELYLFCKDKLSVATDIVRTNGLVLENMLYIGDDQGDIELVRKAGVSMAPQDASDAVISCADHVCQRRGGEGIITEVVSMLESARCGKRKKDGLKW
jgi:YrbI family 3-deoxy-D-manno-octulosonate 8-phosphate phosphatase